MTTNHTSRRRGAMLATLALAALAAAPAVAGATAPEQAGFYITSADGNGADLLKAHTGETISASVTVFNTSRRPKVVRLQAADLDTASAGGVAYVTTRLRRSGTWIQLRGREVRVPAGRSVRVRFSIAVPSGVRDGAHYAGIVATDARPAATTAAKAAADGKRSFQVRRVMRVAVPLTIALPGRRHHALSYNGASLKTDGARPALSLKLNNTGNELIKGAGVSLRVLHDGKPVLKHNAQLAQLMPGSALNYNIGWTGPATAGTYRVVGVITPQGAKPVGIDQVLSVSGKQAGKAAEQLQPDDVAPVAAASVPVALLLALGGAVVLIIGMGVAMWRMRRRMVGSVN